LDEKLENIENTRSEANGLSTAAKTRAQELRDLIDLIPEDIDLESEMNAVDQKRKKFFDILEN